jgi:hypothetical protein
MEISHTDPGHIAVPFAELVTAARAWGDTARLIDDGLSTMGTPDASGFGAQVAPALTERLGRWRAQVALLSQGAADHADALRACAATAELADAGVARRFG